MHRNVLHAACIRALAALALLVGLPSTGAALPLISEVFYDAAGSDNGKSFVELYGTPGSSLDSFVLEGVNGSVMRFGKIRGAWSGPCHHRPLTTPSMRRRKVEVGRHTR